MSPSTQLSPMLTELSCRLSRLGTTALVVLAPLFVPYSALAQGDELSERDLYNLCSRFPYNAQCEGLEIPIPLDERSGSETYCWLEPGDFEPFNRCKFVITGDRLTVYFEEGEPVELLDSRRGTEELVIPLESVWTFHSWLWNYRSGRSVLSGLNEYTLMTAEDEAFAEVAREFAETPNSDERGGASEDFSELTLLFAAPSTAEESETEAGNRSRALRILATDEFGAFFHQQLTAALPAPRLAEIADAVSEPSTAEPPADVSAQVNQLLETKACLRCDLRGADLQDANLARANLEGANLAGANLAGADLDSAYLIGANLDGADLTGADLDGARLVAATFVGANLQEADMRSTLLQGANFQDANLTEANLAGLTAAQHANFSNANLLEATLTNADFEGASFAGANLEMASLQRSPLQRAGDYRLIGGIFSIATNLRNGNLSDANFNGAELQRAIFESANLSNAILTEADLDNADFSGANLSNVDLTDADLDNVNFSSTNLQGIVPADVDLSNANLCGATLPDGSTSEQGC